VKATSMTRTPVNLLRGDSNCCRCPQLSGS
jgi:hypothetical protein